MTTYQLPPLPYGLDELEPIISKEIMDLHYNKHHAGYVNNLNKAIAEYEKEQDLSKKILIDKAIKFNGGGHVNHSIFWTNLAPKSKGGGTAPDGELLAAINKDFGSVEKLTELLSAKANSIQGSGWAWLGYCKNTGRLVIQKCKNQNPLSLNEIIPLLGIDVWEHAYYLQYKNVRADYVKKIWEIVNWKNVAERFAQAKSGK